MLKKIFYSILFLLIVQNSFGQKKLLVSGTAPDFTAFNSKGKTVNLYSELKNGAVVLVFYRGYWSEPCMTFLNQLQDSLSYIIGNGASVLAVTPENLKSIKKTAASTKANFTIISDQNAEIMKLYDVEVKADADYQNQLKMEGIVLKEINETNLNYLPVPAVFVIGKNKKISYIFFEADYSKRPNISDFLEFTKATNLKAGSKKK